MDTSVTEWIQLVGTLSTPVLLLVLASRFDKSQQTRERAEKLEMELRGERLEVYLRILQPFITALAPQTGKANTKAHADALRTITSIKYRETGFRLALFAGDEVVRAYNALMQAAFRGEDNGFAMLGAFSQLLLAIRRSVGNDKTSLSEIEMMEWMITDIDVYRERLQTPQDS